MTSCNQLNFCLADRLQIQPQLIDTIVREGL